MFDADCRPPPDFLRATVPWFADAKIGCVQVRWGFQNRSLSFLTRVQALVLDGLFAVDQFSRSANDLPVQFNGTNGIWRRAAIDEAGGWNPDHLAEDLDLSFRAQLVGWRVLSLRDYAVPTEIPPDMAAFRAQQTRWALGSAQLVRALGLRILRSELPLREKIMMCMHLGRHSIDPLILMACFTAPLTTLGIMPFLFDYGATANTALVLVVAASCAVFYAVAIRYTGGSQWRLLLVPAVMLLAIGMSLVYTTAFIRGIFQRGGAFVRTPKSGATTGEPGPRYGSPRAPIALLDVLVAVAHAIAAVLTFREGVYAYVPFFAAVSVSFGWVGIASLSTGRARGRRA
jgi:cellulose synthase/poly-beta-1,6-N-acetylglucosamine synthase-like glycosyltransferase